MRESTPYLAVDVLVANGAVYPIDAPSHREDTLE